jgi:hypothetical protein
MRVRLNIKPGRSGTKKLVAEYGERLVCVRYRYDEKRKKRLKTVELIVEETDWEPPRPPFKDDEIVGVELDFKERELRSKVLRAGGTFDAAHKVWQLRYDRALRLGLKGRIRPIKPI